MSRKSNIESYEKLLERFLGSFGIIPVYKKSKGIIKLSFSFMDLREHNTYFNDSLFDDKSFKRVAIPLIWFKSGRVREYDPYVEHYRSYKEDKKKWNSFIDRESAAKFFLKKIIRDTIENIKFECAFIKGSLLDKSKGKFEFNAYKFFKPVDYLKNTNSLEELSLKLDILMV